MSFWKSSKCFWIFWRRIFYDPQGGHIVQYRNLRHPSPPKKVRRLLWTAPKANSCYKVGIKYCISHPWGFKDCSTKHYELWKTMQFTALHIFYVASALYNDFAPMWDFKISKGLFVQFPTNKKKTKVETIGFLMVWN